ncbi:Probable histone deacetylase 1-B [Aduncisulcus paluster]|uniref:Histone deacetylase n=1 Tax=Aduncisulcus paluster TaxID=2918883 RepID=A0ABQ5JSE0_9EUKA|nr:Probable histone deacetylase 1-B [Aduncisulcus paluster]
MSADTNREVFFELMPKVNYFYSPDFGGYYYGAGHPMRPFRMSLVHELVVSYGLHRHLNIYEPRPASVRDMTAFHADEYIKFIREATPETYQSPTCKDHLRRFGINDECPIFSGLYDFCATACGASIGAAAQLASKDAEICINFMGGYHHAKISEASGFCYCNDIVLAILELLKAYERVLYIDIDIHHGDGVEEAFYTSDRVMTLSFHKYGDQFFPGTGARDDIGRGDGRGFAVNFPFTDGVRDDMYLGCFKPVIDNVLKYFKPSAIVMQCGADSLANDRLGSFNLTLNGHGECVRYIRDTGLPLLVLGGGGYTLRNVARCWTYETAVLCRHAVSEEIPFNRHYEYYSPHYLLNILPTNMLDRNTAVELTKETQRIVDQLKRIGCPGAGYESIGADISKTVSLWRLKGEEEEDEKVDEDQETRKLHRKEEEEEE